MTTMCGKPVDLTTEEQRASHRLREAAICARCHARWMRLPLPRPDPKLVFTASGGRRHYQQ